MKDIKQRISAAYKAVSISKMVYDETPFYKKLEFILLIPAVIAFYFVFQIRSSPFASYISIAASVILTIGSAVALNQFFKWRLARKGIKSKKSIKEHWFSEDFVITRLKQFYKELQFQKLLKGKKKDIKILEDYISFMQEESKSYFNSDGVLVGGTILLLFIHSVWGELIKHLIEGAVKDDYLNKTMGLIFISLSLIYLVIYLLFLIKKGLNEIINTTSNRYKNISRLMEQLRINLKIKYG